MVASIVTNTRREDHRHAPHAYRSAQDTWAFVYIFFTNGIPFDSPNRSEPCPRR